MNKKRERGRLIGQIFFLSIFVKSSLLRNRGAEDLIEKMRIDERVGSSEERNLGLCGRRICENGGSLQISLYDTDGARKGSKSAFTVHMANNIIV